MLVNENKRIDKNNIGKQIDRTENYAKLPRIRKIKENFIRIQKKIKE